MKLIEKLLAYLRSIQLYLTDIFLLMKNALVSIVMPTFNRAPLLPRAIKSVLEQTYSNWELIIVDDASKDNTKDVIKYFSDKDKRISYILLNTNSGASVARNEGIRVAKGEFITFLDSDDEYLPEKVELQIKCFQESNIGNLGVVSCGRQDFRNDIKYSEWNPSVRGNILKNLLRKERIGAGTPFLMVIKDLLLSKSILFDPEMPASQDWDFLVRVCQHANFDFVAMPLVKVNHHSGDRVYTNDRAVLAFDKQYKKYKSLLLENSNVHDLFVLKMAVQCYVYGYHLRALELLSRTIINRDIKILAWELYIKLSNGGNSILNKAAFKTLKKITAV